MATQVKPFSPDTDLHQEPLDDFVLIRTKDIVAGERLRAIDTAWAEALGEMMAKDGQDTPIKVCRLPGQSCWTLVVGAHRHAGAISAGVEYLRAEIVTANRDDRRLHEVRENLFRRDLSPMDRAAFLAEAVAILKTRAGLDPFAGRQVGAAARWQAAVKDEAADATATLAVAYGFTDTVASELGLSSRTVERGLMLYRRIAPSLIEQLRKHDHPAAKQQKQLEALAKLEASQQKKVVELLTWPGASLNYGQPTTVAEAIAHPLGPKPVERAKPDAETKRLSSFVGAFARMSIVERRAALSQLAPQLPPGTDLSNVERPKAGFPAQHERYRDETLEAIDGALLVLDGMEEDGLIPTSHEETLQQVLAGLRIARLTIAGNGFDLSNGKGA
ncbi:hypothetical protein D9602_01665 [Sphingomonas sp. TX0522]|nr:ParB N-terminal domain-containing protein [Sphingomonas sp. TX0522]MBI0530062.1 hypothetical protein [Sphingomonas sp. TX0522]